MLYSPLVFIPYMPNKKGKSNSHLSLCIVVQIKYKFITKHVFNKCKPFQKLSMCFHFTMSTSIMCGSYI